MFDPSPNPRVFAVPPGADFPAAVVDGILTAHANQPPETLARTRIFVNTERMRRRMTDLFAQGPARLLPRIHLVTDTPQLVPWADLPQPAQKIARSLEFARLIAPLLDGEVAPAPRSALFDLADSLTALLDEMHSEGVAPDDILNLDVTDQSGHWARAQSFLGIVRDYLDATHGTNLDPEARFRAATNALIDSWQSQPPETPVLVIGSTGSRGTTFELMKAAARLPQGAVVLPGFDRDLPHNVWKTLSRSDDSQPLEDHPQFRFSAFLGALDITPDDVQDWPAITPDPQRNRLISLSLRPAPVTDQWRAEGPALGDLVPATEGLSIIEAPQSRDEALAIAVALRNAIDSGQTAALITSDRTLGRRVTAALQRWDITPDDSAGRPLSLTPPGRLLRQIARVMGTDPRAEDVIGILKHPLTQTGGEDRGPHLRNTRELELLLRRKSAVAVSETLLTKFVDDDEGRTDWTNWLRDLLGDFAVSTVPTLGASHTKLISIAEMIARGQSDEGTGQLWEQNAGRKTREVCDRLDDDAIAAAPMPPTDYLRLLDKSLAAEDARETDETRPDVMIWGTLEARVQGADLVILGGLNEGTWPSRATPDPWLSRQMRRDAGLLSPERQIGLSAHDYQQAVAAKSGILSRTRRDDEAETVPSRWINRLLNLLGGLPDQNGPDAVLAMKARGQSFLDVAAALDAPTGEPEPEPRQAPAPPTEVRPKSFTVTEIEKLIRDPYAIYARYILKLSALNPLRPEPGAAMRGDAFHAVMECFVRCGPHTDTASAQEKFMEIAQDVLADKVPWPAIRALWFAHLSTIAPRIAEEEIARQSGAKNVVLEEKGAVSLPGTPFEIRGKADRIDQRPDGDVIIYDYKSGQAPSKKQIRYYQRQLLIEAVMAEHGAFKKLGPVGVALVEYLALNRAGKNLSLELTEHELDKTPVDFRPATIERELTQLLTHFHQSSQGYVSRRAMESLRWDGDFDHLARFGEWSATDEIETVPLP